MNASASMAFASQFAESAQSINYLIWVHNVRLSPGYLSRNPCVLFFLPAFRLSPFRLFACFNPTKPRFSWQAHATLAQPPHARRIEGHFLHFSSAIFQSGTTTRELRLYAYRIENRPKTRDPGH